MIGVMCASMTNQYAIDVRAHLSFKSLTYFSSPFFWFSILGFEKNCMKRSMKEY